MHVLYYDVCVCECVFNMLACVYVFIYVYVAYMSMYMYVRMLDGVHVSVECMCRVYCICARVSECSVACSSDPDP